MDHRHREKLLRMREEDQLPQTLIIMVERAEHEMKMLGGGILSVRDLVVLSAVVPRVPQSIEEAMEWDESGILIPLVAGTLVNVSVNGSIERGKILAKHGDKFKVKVDGDEKPYRIIEVQYLEAI